MTYQAAKELVLLQLGEDLEDMADFVVFLEKYLQDAYDELMKVRKGFYDTTLPALSVENKLPAYVHKALVDYATYAILTNGNAQKQARAQVYYGRFALVISSLTSEADDEAEAAARAAGTSRKFTGLYDF